MSQLIVYQPEDSDNSIELPVDIEHRTVWATQRKIADTLDLDVSTVSRHITNFKEQRGDRAKRDIANFAITADDGKSYDVEHYNLTVIAYVGFRAQATERVIAFQEWVGEQLDKVIAQHQTALTPTQALLKAVERMVEVERDLQALQRQNAELDRKQSEAFIQIEATNERITDSEYFTVRQWCQLQRIKVKHSVMQKWGKQAASLSRARGIEIRPVNEGEYNVGSYHKSVLVEVCVAKQHIDINQLKLTGSDN